MVRIMLFIFIILSFLSFGQTVQNSRILNHNSDNLWILTEKIAGRSFVLNTDTIQYYGVDFSHFKLAVPDTDTDSTAFVIDFEYWTSELNKRIIGDSNNIRLSKVLKKEILLGKADTGSNHPKDFDAMLDTVVPDYSSLKIQDIIARYPKTEDQYIGFAIIVESFDHITNRVIADFVFFKPGTDQLLWYLKIQAPVKNVETRRKWSEGLHSVYFRFRKTYNKRRKE